MKFQPGSDKKGQPDINELQAQIDELRLQLYRSELKFNTREDHLSSIARGLKLGFWEWDEIKQKQIYCSAEVATIFGEDPAKVKESFDSIEDFAKWVHPDDLDHYLAFNDPKKRKNMSFESGIVYDYRIIDNAGQVRYLRELEYGQYDANGVLVTSYGIIQDVTEYREIVEALTRSEQRYSTLYHGLPVGVQEEDYSSIKRLLDKLVFQGVDDLQAYLRKNSQLLKEMIVGARFTQVNQALLDLHRAKSKDQFFEIEDDVESWWDADWDDYYSRKIASLYHHGYFEAEHVDSRTDYSLFEARVISRVMPGSEQDWRRVVTMHEDITDRKQAEIELRKATEIAQKASEAKSEFLSSMSHELRTPLNAIMGFSELLDYDPEISDKQRRVVNEISRAGKYLTDLINQVLDLSTIEAGEVVLCLEPTDLANILDECVSWIRPIAAKYDVSIDFQAELFRNVWVNADQVRLKQVFLNLLSNAVKYNKEKGNVHVVLDKSDASTCRIGVSDTGIGINSDQLEMVFEPFNRLGAELTEIEGTGIGLGLSRKLIEHMNGQLDVDTEQGVGSVFWVTLSQTSDPGDVVGQADIEASEDYPPAVISNCKLLVAEDNPVNRELIAAQIELLGYQADFATNGVEAISMLQQGGSALLLTDIRMNDMDGFELSQTLRQQEIQGKRIPIIAVTANAQPEDIERCYASGIDDVLSKPVSLDDLRIKLEQWLAIDVAVGEADNGEAAVDLSVFNAQTLKLSTGDKPDLHHKLLSDFKDSLPQILEDIQQAFAWKNHGRLSSHSHRLKSSARSLGLDMLGDVASRLEQASEAGNWSEIEYLVPLLGENMELAKDTLQQLLQVEAGQVSSVDIDLQQTAQMFPAEVERDLSVLLVDDDYVMHRVTSVILNDLGVTHIQNAISGTAALDLIQGVDRPLDIVICDLNMPGMDGIEFLRHLSRSQFEGAVILASGEDARILKTVEKLAIENDLHVLGVLEKPVHPIRLNALLEGYEQFEKEGSILKPALVNEKQLKEALDNDQIDVYFQPKVEVKSGKVVGVEALARWQHAQLGMIRPDIFVDLAEEHGLIEQLTDCVCRKVIHYAEQLKGAGIELNFAINISVDALTDLEWPDRIAGWLDDNGLENSNISLEITESHLMENLSVALDILSRLSLKNFKLSIDDFGTGYSSMEQLQRVPFTELKIDRAFVHGATDDSSAKAILESNVILARKLGMEVVAEGVENQSDWDLVEELGCDQVQGFFVSRPMPFKQLRQWLQQRN